MLACVLSVTQWPYEMSCGRRRAPSLLSAASVTLPDGAELVREQTNVLCCWLGQECNVPRRARVGVSSALGTGRLCTGAQLLQSGLV